MPANFIPAEVFCLSSYLCEEIQARGWTTEDVAVRMQTPAGARMDLFRIDIIMCVPDEQLIITDDIFAGLARAFDVSEQMLRNIHAIWLKYPDRRYQFDVPDEIFGPTSRRAVMRVVKN